MKMYGSLFLNQYEIDHFSSLIDVPLHITAPRQTLNLILILEDLLEDYDGTLTKEINKLGY